jgi:hypothetical protein
MDLSASCGAFENYGMKKMFSILKIRIPIDLCRCRLLIRSWRGAYSFNRPSNSLRLLQKGRR